MSKGLCAEPVDHPQYAALKKQIMDGSEWLTAGVINYARRKLGLEQVSLHEWEKEGRVFSVLYKNRRYYAAYQLDSSYQPLPVIRLVLEAYGDYLDSWEIAMWFHFPNGWIVDDANPIVMPSSPKDVLRQVTQMIEAARNRRGTYVA